MLTCSNSSLVTALVIEYGPFDQCEDGVMIPDAYFTVPYLWLSLMSAPQFALNDTSYPVPCGRTVAGGSEANAMFSSPVRRKLLRHVQHVRCSGMVLAKFPCHTSRRARLSTDQIGNMRQSTISPGMMQSMASRDPCRLAMRPTIT